MKTFIVSIVTFIVLVIGVTLNCIYIENTASSLSDATDSLSKSVEDADISHLCEIWDTAKPRLSLSIDHKETDAIGDTITQIKVQISLGEQNAYESAVATLKNQLDRLAESEALAFDRIF